MTRYEGPIRLLPREALVKTGEVDHADWNFQPILGWIQRLRFRLLVDLLGNRHYPRLLEIGYGSGVFMPELAHRCGELHGIDPHQKDREVSRILAEHGINATLVSCPAESIPYPNATFDCIVVVSALEFFEDGQAACSEISRVLKPDGEFVLVTPGHGPVVDFGLKILTGEDAQDDYGDRRQHVMSTLMSRFVIQEQRTASLLGIPPIRLYRAMRLVAKDTP